MKTRLLISLLALVTAPALARAQSPTTVADTLKKISARYALTEKRIAELVGRRLDPQPLPASLPNPFYLGVELSELADLEPEPVLPDAPDISDADTLAKIAPALRISGLVIRDGKPHLIINTIVCKAGDVIPIPGRDTPIFIQVRKISADSFTLGLNDAEITMPLKL